MTPPSYLQPVEGELLIGGMDRFRVAGPFTNYTMDRYPMKFKCPLTVKVKRVTLNNDRGQHQMIKGDPVVACVDLLQNQITFTKEMYSLWADATEHPNETDGPPFTYQTYPKAKEHLMKDLEIELEGGFIKTVQHHELVGPERGAVLNELGQYGVINSSRIMSAVGTGITDYGEDFGMLLGGSFLAGTYLFADYERNSWGLAAAVMEQDESRDESIEPICSLDTSIPKDPTEPDPPTNTATASPSPSGLTSNGLSTSDKIGLGVGIPSALGVIVGIFALWLNTRQHRQVLRHNSIPMASPQIPSQEILSTVAPPRTRLNSDTSVTLISSSQGPSIQRGPSIPTAGNGPPSPRSPWSPNGEEETEIPNTRRHAP